MKCARTVCENTARMWHTQRRQWYCPRCAKKINETNPGLVVIPTVADVNVGDRIEILDIIYHEGNQQRLVPSGRFYEVAPECHIIGARTCFDLRYGHDLKVGVAPSSFCQLAEDA